jgi:hypothetical protein
MLNLSDDLNNIEDFVEIRTYNPFLRGNSID